MECLNNDYCETSATAQQTKQVGSLVMLSNAIMSLRGGDERAFSDQQTNTKSFGLLRVSGSELRVDLQVWGVLCVTSFELNCTLVYKK